MGLFARLFKAGGKSPANGAGRSTSAGRPVVNVPRPQLPGDAEDAGAGVLVYEMTHHEKPAFYDGPIPILYTAGKRNLGPGQMYTVYHQFKAWRTRFFHSDLAMKFSGIADGARSVDLMGRVLAEARLVQVLPGQGLVIEEFHYGLDGAVRFTCKSRISFALGAKESETEVRGEKQRDYYFLWPVSGF